METALREAKEEIGLDPSLVNVVTVLKPFITKVSCVTFFSSACFIYDLFEYESEYLRLI